MDWKVNAFAAEVARVYGAGDRRKNVLSLGDSASKKNISMPALFGRYPYEFNTIQYQVIIIY